MKKTGLIMTVATICLVAMVLATGTADAASESAKPSFPSISEIFSTIQLPDYSFSTFIEDVKYIFSSDMSNQLGSYLGSIGTFLMEDTFLGNIGGINGDTFSGDNGYVNVFVLLCLLIALACILGAVISYLINRDTFKKARKSV